MGIRLALALQGGGAHGAFSWGVLDRLLEIPGIEITEISATSSGAMNASVLAQGWSRGGAAGARSALDALWTTIAQRQVWPAWWFAAQRALMGGSRILAPCLPLAENPLRGLVERLIDIDAIRASPVRLHLATTRVRDGALVLFESETISHSVLLASACLPHIFPAERIEGESYWDGGFAGNPVLDPLLRSRAHTDVLCVLLRPLVGVEVPSLPARIAEHQQAIAFQTAFRRELDSLLERRAQLAGRWLFSPRERHLSKLRLHLIEPAQTLGEGRSQSHLDSRRHVLLALREAGRARAEQWLAGNATALGRFSSLERSLAQSLRKPSSGD